MPLPLCPRGACSGRAAFTASASARRALARRDASRSGQPPFAVAWRRDDEGATRLLASEAELEGVDLDKYRVYVPEKAHRMLKLHKSVCVLHGV